MERSSRAANRPITSLDDAFEEIQIRELATWKSTLNEIKVTEYLIHPSGSLMSPLAH